MAEFKINEIGSNTHQNIKNRPGDGEEPGGRSERGLFEHTKLVHSIAGEKRNQKTAAEGNSDSKGEAPDFAPGGEGIRLSSCGFGCFGFSSCF